MKLYTFNIYIYKTFTDNNNICFFDYYDAVIVCMERRLVTAVFYPNTV